MRDEVLIEALYAIVGGMKHLVTTDWTRDHSRVLTSLEHASRLLEEAAHSNSEEHPN